MKVAFVYPAFDRHADSHPELKDCVPADEYVGPPSLGIASVAATTPPGHELTFVDDRVTPFDPETDADLFALSCFTPAATRALEIADALRRRNKRVVMGGIFPSMMPEVAAEHCDAVVVGEGEATWPQLVADAERGELKPRYEAPPIPDLSPLPAPRVDLYLAAESEAHRPDDYPLQLSRGCPLHCDACVLPEHMGHGIRPIGRASLVETLTAFARAGKLISLTEDTSIFGIQGTRRRFREFLALCASLRRGGLEVRLSYLGISMPMILHLDESILVALRDAGIDRFYLVGGFDNITRAAFGQGDPAALDRARRCIERCHRFGIEPYVSFLVGNDGDDDRVFERMLQFCRETGIDLAEFCIATPYPGTPRWKRLLAEGRIFDRTWKHYNDANVVFHPQQMDARTLEDGYRHLWREFYRGRAPDLGEREHPRRTIQF